MTSLFASPSSSSSPSPPPPREKVKLSSAEPKRRRPSSPAPSPRKVVVVEDPPWVEQAKGYFGGDGNVFRDVGCLCSLCLELPSSCVLLRSACCGALLCFTCYANATQVHCKGPDVAGFVMRARLDIDLGQLPSRANLLPEVTGPKCPHCRQVDAVMTVVWSPEMTWLRQLHAATAATLETGKLVAVLPVNIPCSCDAKGHTTDKAWALCTNGLAYEKDYSTGVRGAAFELACPTSGCTEPIVVRPRSDQDQDGTISVSTAVAEHFRDRCNGRVECPCCVQYVDGGKWHSQVSVRQLRRHYQLHNGLYGVWLVFRSMPLMWTSLATRGAWFNACRQLFQGLDATVDTEPFGGREAVAIPGGNTPVRRLLAGLVAPEKRPWCEPWMRAFMNAMSNVSHAWNTFGLAGEDVQKQVGRRDEQLRRRAFSLFFNAAYERLFNDDEDADIPD